jgi:hypothetical protein
MVCLSMFDISLLYVNSHQAPHRIDWISSQRIDQGRISFLDLPLELREMVYLEALSTESAILLRERTGSTSARPQHEIVDENEDTHISPALLCVSHQMHHEAIQFLYQRNTFKWNFNRIAGSLSPHSGRNSDDAYDIFGHTRSTYRHLVQNLQPEVKFSRHGDLNWAHLLRLINVMTGRYKNLKVLHFQVLSDPGMWYHGDWARYLSNSPRNPLDKQALVEECHKRLRAICRLEGQKVPKYLKVTFVPQNSLGERYTVPPSQEVLTEALEKLKLARRL